MGRWLAAQGTPRLLPEALWKQAWKPGVLLDGKPTGYGFGWMVGSLNGVPTVEHGGGIPGFASTVRRVPSKGLAVVVLTDSDGGDPSGVANRLLATADESLGVQEAAVPRSRPAGETAATLRLLHQFEAGEPDAQVMSKDLAALLTPEDGHRPPGPAGFVPAPSRRSG